MATRGNSPCRQPRYEAASHLLTLQAIHACRSATMPPRESASTASSARQSHSGHSLYQPATSSWPASARACTSGFSTARPVRPASLAAALCPPTGPSVPTAAMISPRRAATSSAAAADQRRPSTSVEGINPAEVAASHCHPASPVCRSIMWNVIASQAPGGRGSDDGADGPSGPRSCYASPAMSTWRHLFEHGQHRNLLFGRDSFVNMVPVRI